MKLFSSIFLVGLVNGWDQPSYKDARKIVNQRSDEPWGRPVNTRRKLQSRLWSDCPAPTLPENSLEAKCQRSTCMLRCKPGFIPSGRKRIACRKRGANFTWIKEFGTCKSCTDQNPSADDPSVKTVCRTNNLGRKSCVMSCPPGRPLNGFPLPRIKLTCKCPRGNCDWMKGQKTIDYKALTCRTAAPGTTKSTTRRTTRPKTTQPPVPPREPEEGAGQNDVNAESELSEFERGGLHLTATQSCDVNQFGRFFGDSKIINGVTAGRAAWPWIVSMSFFRFEFGGAALCGGSIISDRWVISAAHCCRSSIKVQITVGEFNRMAVDSGQFTVESRTMIRHPKYQSGNGMDWDACLIKVPSLKANAPSSCKNCFTAACLPQVPPKHGRHCWVAGWGHTQEGSGISSRLMEVGVNLMDWEYCTTKSTYGTVVNKVSELCAGIPDRNLDGFVDGGKDACQGDSGGPLVCNDNGAATMYGLVSWGEGCARKGAPGIYADVFAIKGWIQTTIRNN